jgi:hypothetical protein
VRGFGKRRFEILARNPLRTDRPGTRRSLRPLLMPAGQREESLAAISRRLSLLIN